MKTVWTTCACGDLPGTVAPFCPVDNLILSVCAYVPWEEAVPTLRDGDWLPLPPGGGGPHQPPGLGRGGPPSCPRTPPHPGGGGRPRPRFRPLALGCREHVQDENTQFAALTYRLPDGTLPGLPGHRRLPWPGGRSASP